MSILTSRSSTTSSARSPVRRLRTTGAGGGGTGASPNASSSSPKSDMLNSFVVECGDDARGSIGSWCAAAGSDAAGGVSDVGAETVAMSSLVVPASAAVDSIRTVD